MLQGITQIAKQQSWISRAASLSGTSSFGACVGMECLTENLRTPVPIRVARFFAQAKLLGSQWCMGMFDRDGWVSEGNKWKSSHPIAAAVGQKTIVVKREISRPFTV